MENDELKIILEAALDLEKSLSTITAQINQLREKCDDYQIRIKAGLNQAASAEQIKRDLAQLNKTKNCVDLVGQMDRDATKKNIDSMLKRLKDTEIRIAGVLDSATTTSNIKDSLNLLGTGCRVGEVIGLRWSDCDFDGGIIHIDHNLIYRQGEGGGNCCFRITTPKTKAGTRIVPMLSEVRQALLDERERQTRCGFNKTVIDGYSGFIFQNRYGDCLSPHCINRAIERISRDYNTSETKQAHSEDREPLLLPHFTAHNLRHTFCTRFCEHETNLKIIQEIMGHADISTTMNIYNEATKEKKLESFANLEGKIKIS